MRMLGIAAKPAQNPHAGEGLIAMVLEVLENKDIWTKQLAELASQREQCNAAFKQANDAINQANDKWAKIEAAEKDLADREVALEQEQAEFHQTQSAWNEMTEKAKAAMSNLGERLDAAEAAVNQKQAEIQARAGELDARTVQLDAREKTLAENEKAAAAMKAEYTEKLGKLKALAG